MILYKVKYFTVNIPDLSLTDGRVLLYSLRLSSRAILWLLVYGANILIVHSNTLKLFLSSRHAYCTIESKRFNTMTVSGQDSTTNMGNTFAHCVISTGFQLKKAFIIKPISFPLY